MSTIYSPQQKFVTATDAVGGVTLTFTTQMGSVYMQNTGSNPVWFTFDGTPTAVDGNGQNRLAPGAGINIDNTDFRTITFICSAALTTGIQVIAHQRPGANGTGY